MNLQTQLEEAKAHVLKLVPELKARFAITLGSGLSHFAQSLENKVSIPFSTIPHFAQPTIAGHGGNLIVGTCGGVPLLVLQGRVHYYEGNSWEQVVFPTRLLAALGMKGLLLTNASGGLNPKMRPGCFMVITDQINLTGSNPLRGPNPDFLGVRFPDMSQLYDRKLAKSLAFALKKSKNKIFSGVYCGVTGPSYETAAEIQYFRRIGGSAVGMSTVAEAIAGRHAGLKLAGLSCITNLGTGLSKTTLTHEEVTLIAKQSEQKFTAAINHFITQLGPEFRP